VTSVTGDSHSEMIRRLRLGNLRTLFRNRYGAILPDDDAGREDIRELLLPISVGPNAEIKMRKAMEVWSPWLPLAEAAQLIDQINRTPIYHRKPNAQQLGFRQRVTNQERERLRLWTIAPYDMTEEGIREQRKAKDRERKRRLREKRGSKPRAIYEAESISKAKPWEQEGISRRTWYYRQQKADRNKRRSATIPADDWRRNSKLPDERLPLHKSVRGKA
jgi:hypothetical protein